MSTKKYDIYKVWVHSGWLINVSAYFHVYEESKQGGYRMHNGWINQDDGSRSTPNCDIEAHLLTPQTHLQCDIYGKGSTYHRTHLESKGKFSDSNLSTQFSTLTPECLPTQSDWCGCSVLGFLFTSSSLPSPELNQLLSTVIFIQRTVESHE
jgi:hypothetical protein